MDYIAGYTTIIDMTAEDIHQCNLLAAPVEVSFFAV